jgi:hypothetical protein
LKNEMLGDQRRHDADSLVRSSITVLLGRCRATRGGPRLPLSSASLSSRRAQQIMAVTTDLNRGCLVAGGVVLVGIGELAMGRD